MSDIKCPHCGAQQTQDFGIMNCPSCGAVLMVDIEGQVQLMNSSVESSDVPSDENPTGDNSGVPAPSEYQELSFAPFADEMSAAAVAADVLSQPLVEEASAQEPDPQEDFQDIQDFGNSDLPTSPLMYTLVIEGIDRGDLRRDLQEIFSDERFKLDPRETLEQIKDGRLELNGLNAVKASVLVIRLRKLPLLISWRQHAYQT